MSSTGTQTNTYTVADIRKVVDNFAADFSMMAQATGLRTRESVEEDVSDLKVFAEYGYLVQVKVILWDRDGNKLRAAEYKVAKSAVGWTSDRPGGNLWPKTPDGLLYVLATLNDAWWNKTESEKNAFIRQRELHSSWAKNDKDTSLSGLSSSSGQRYSSNGYGWERTNFSKGN